MDETPTKFIMDAGLTQRQQIPDGTPIMIGQLLDEDGNPIRMGGELQPASKTQLGGVKMSNAIADTEGAVIEAMQALTGTGTDPATINQVNVAVGKLNDAIARINAIQTTQDKILANLRGSGVIATSD